MTAFCCLQEVNQLAVDVHLVTMIMTRRREIVMIMRYVDPPGVLAFMNTWYNNDGIEPENPDN